MSKLKYEVGDKVTINKRCPDELKHLLRRNRARTIVSRTYDPDKQCNYFYLGQNFRGKANDLIEAYPFRSYMLNPVVKGRKPGRPRSKRGYKRRK